MKCKHCHYDFSATRGQTSPGGSSSPGAFFWLFVIAIALCVIAIYGEWGIAWIFGFGLAVLVIFCAWITAYSDCSQYDEQLGKKVHSMKCPKCEQRTPLYPWSI